MRVFFAFLFIFALAFNAYGQQNCDSPEPDGIFIRGDFDNNGTIEITDLINLSNWIGSSGAPPCELDSADVNDDGDHDISDIIYLSNFIAGGDEPPHPWPNNGDDITGDFIHNAHSPMPGGQNYKPTMSAREADEGGEGDPEVCGGATARSEPGYHRWDYSEDYAPLGPVGIYADERVVRSRNVGCFGRNTVDWWKLTFCTNRNHSAETRFNNDIHKGHVTHRALSHFVDNVPDVKIKLSLSMDVWLGLDCDCQGTSTIDSVNKVEFRLGLPDKDSIIKIYLHSMTGHHWLLKKKIGSLLLDKKVEYSDYSGECTGEGYSWHMLQLPLEFGKNEIPGEGDPDFWQNAYPVGQVNPEDIMKVDKVEIDGIVHLSAIVSGYELSRYDLIDTLISAEVEYIWREK
jgi:hypothetical protein